MTDPTPPPKTHEEVMPSYEGFAASDPDPASPVHRDEDERWTIRQIGKNDDGTPQLIADGSADYTSGSWTELIDDFPQIEVVPLSTLQAARSRADSLQARVDQVEGALRDLADIHHRTLSGSRKHDPEHREWDECDCLTCRAAQDALSDQEEARA